MNAQFIEYLGRHILITRDGRKPSKNHIQFPDEIIGTLGKTLLCIQINDLPQLNLAIDQLII